MCYWKTKRQSFSLCPRCPSCGDRSLPYSPSGGPVLKAGVYVQSQPFVSHSDSVLVDVDICKMLQAGTCGMLCFSLTSSNLTGQIL